MDAEIRGTGVVPPSGNSSEPMMKNATDTPSGPFFAKIYRESILKDMVRANTVPLMRAKRRLTDAWGSAFLIPALVGSLKSVSAELRCGRRSWKSEEGISVLKIDWLKNFPS